MANYTTGFNIKTKKKANIYKESKLYKIENVLYLMVPLIILFVITAIFHLSNLKYGDYTNNYSLVYFEEFYRLYFQLFSTILSVVCINYKSGCVSIMSLYMNDNINLYDFNLSVSKPFEKITKIIDPEIKTKYIYAPRFTNTLAYLDLGNKYVAEERKNVLLKFLVENGIASYEDTIKKYKKDKK